jgi:hypothetical protein
MKEIKLGDIFTVTRNDTGASSGYATKLFTLKNLALTEISREIKPGWEGAIKTHFTFQAVKEGPAMVQFAVYRNCDLATLSVEEPLEFDVKPSADRLKAAGLITGGWAGGWIPFAKFDGNETATGVFEEAFGKDSNYTPRLVTSQVVGNGANYIFAGNLSLSLGGKISERMALVRISKEGENPAQLVRLETPSFPVPGSTWNSVYGPAGDLIDPQKQPLDEEMKNRVGIGFNALIAASRPKDFGKGTVFAGNLNFLDKDTTIFPALLTIATVSGKSEIVSIERVFDIV